jgi:hypothetical protein
MNLLVYKFIGKEHLKHIHTISNKRSHTVIASYCIEVEMTIVMDRLF